MCLRPFCKSQIIMIITNRYYMMRRNHAGVKSVVYAGSLAWWWTQNLLGRYLISCTRTARKLQDAFVIMTMDATLTTSTSFSREPHFFKLMDISIDHFHHQGHTRCSQAYDSKNYSDIENSSLSEQKNSFFAEVRSLAVITNQETCLWFIREKLYRMNKLQRLKNTGRLFWSRHLNDPISEMLTVVVHDGEEVAYG